MRSATSSSERVRQWFYPAIFKKNVARFWPLWMGWGLVWFLLVVPRILSYADRTSSSNPTQFPRQPILYAIISQGPWLAAFFGILAAMALFSYLYYPRSAGFFHALPVRREGLFFTHYSSGLLFLFVPLLFVALLAGLTELWLGKGFDFSSLFLLVFCVGMMGFFFYSFAVFCAMFTGHILALPAFYGILNGLVWVIMALFNELCSRFLFGYTNGDWSSWLDRMVLWLTPLLNLYRELNYDQDYHLVGLFPIFVYAFFGLVLTVLALVVYRRRRVESAGDVVAVSWVRPLFKYGVALCAGVVLGSGTWTLFLDSDYHQPFLLALCVLLWGGAGYFISEMLLRKSFWVFRTGWKGAALSMAVLALLCGSLIFDLAGYESRVPAAESVASVEVLTSTYPNDSAGFPFILNTPQEVAAAVAFHQSIVDQREALKQSSGSGYSESATASGTHYVTSDTFYVEFIYRLNQGGTVSRRYSLLPVSDSLLEEPDSLSAQLTALINRPEVLEHSYFGAYRAEKLSGAYLQIEGDQGAYDQYDQEYVSLEEARRLLEAVRSDLEAGRMGRRFLMYGLDYVETCYNGELVFLFRTDQGGGEMRTDSVTVTLRTTARDTLSVLETLDLEQFPVPLLT